MLGACPLEAHVQEGSRRRWSLTPAASLDWPSPTRLSHQYQTLRHWPTWWSTSFLTVCIREVIYLFHLQAQKAIYSLCWAHNYDKTTDMSKWHKQSRQWLTVEFRRELQTHRTSHESDHFNIIMEEQHTTVSQEFHKSRVAFQTRPKKSVSGFPKIYNATLKTNCDRTSKANAWRNVLGYEGFVPYSLWTEQNPMLTVA